MARYELRLAATATKDLRGIPKADVRRILARIQGLRDDPRPAGAEKLTGQDLYRLRQGSYRILYSVRDALVQVQVIKIGHRRDVYRSR